MVARSRDKSGKERSLFLGKCLPSPRATQRQGKSNATPSVKGRQARGKGGGSVLGHARRSRADGARAGSRRARRAAHAEAAALQRAFPVAVRLRGAGVTGAPRADAGATSCMPHFLISGTMRLSFHSNVPPPPARSETPATLNCSWSSRCACAIKKRVASGGAATRPRYRFCPGGGAATRPPRRFPVDRRSGAALSRSQRTSPSSTFCRTSGTRRSSP